MTARSAHQGSAELGANYVVASALSYQQALVPVQHAMRQLLRRCRGQAVACQGTHPLTMSANCLE
jgi:hypothetical protein